MRRDDWLIHQLPVGMAEDEFLVRFLTIFQRVSDTVVQQVDALPHMFDPAVAPTPMVRAMAQWIGVDWVDSSLDDRLQRAIVMEYAELLQWRGTKRGLRRLLRSLSGGADVEVTDSGGVFGEGEASAAPPHVRLDMSRTGWSRVDDVVRIVRQELPASVTFDLWVAGERVWPRPEPVSRAELPQFDLSDSSAPGMRSEGDDG
ncbi:MAG TPA: phage tail protein [Ilumatobacter sp.]|jgi:phage tail-like protein|nr:phage tail protein [Ilumatobacter sp.]